LATSILAREALLAYLISASRFVKIYVPFDDVTGERKQTTVGHSGGVDRRARQLAALLKCLPIPAA
jgi:hypothetical protein